MIPLPPKPAFSESSPYWAAARDIFTTLRGLGASTPLAVAAIANADMESALKTDVVGDRDTAYNLWQHHWNPRGNRILASTQIDLRHERDVTAVCRALWWELSNVHAYAHAFAEMQAALRSEDAAGIFCAVIEGAGAADAKERRQANAEIWTVLISMHADFFGLDSK